MIIGITAEWNPFHKGHYEMIRQLRNTYDDVPIIAIMSGSFVQRGEPALFDKWTRSEWALRCGVDIVMEYPVIHALQSADFFAHAAVKLLSSAGCTHIAFGTESLTADTLQSLSVYAMGEQYQKDFQNALEQKIPYGKAITKALKNFSPAIESEIQKPNNLLGFRYVLSSLQQHIPLTPITIHRDMSHPISSSILRKALLSKTDTDMLPDEIANDVFTKVKNGNYVSPARYDDACLLSSRFFSFSDIQKSGLFTEGLEYAWKKAENNTSYKKMLTQIKSKRYLYSRLKRLGAALLISGNQSPSLFSIKPTPSYLRLLGLRKKKSAILKNCNLPVISKVADAKYHISEMALQSLSLDIRGADIQAWCMHDSSFRKGHSDFYISPIIIE